ncbi:hypothetical protein C1H46_020985 [Malus baccata]|uniref:Uncharacterized protein n=1 Tax=Malus baccata TaxID=106549 RepID=A0A540M3Z5_MALBA|nr:hypothetical protein C1H46_020985 [Malus baccata]
MSNPHSDRENEQSFLCNPRSDPENEQSPLGFDGSDHLIASYGLNKASPCLMVLAAAGR